MFITPDSSTLSVWCFSDLQSHHTHSIDFESFFTCSKKVYVDLETSWGKGKSPDPPEMEFNTHTPFSSSSTLNQLTGFIAFLSKYSGLSLALWRPLEHAKFLKGIDARFFDSRMGSNGPYLFTALQWSKSYICISYVLHSKNTFNLLKKVSSKTYWYLQKFRYIWIHLVAFKNILIHSITFWYI